MLYLIKVGDYIDMNYSVIFDILDILKWHSSVNKPLSQKDIMKYLYHEKNTIISRPTLSKYLNILRDYNLIEGYRGISFKPDFSTNEIRVLIDGVLFGQHIPKKDAEMLINKLKKLGGYDMYNKCRHIHYLQGLNHTLNVELYKLLDLIDTAIDQNKKVYIVPCYYDESGNLTSVSKVLVSPYYLVTEKSRYYLICYNHDKQRLENRRLDRINKVEMTDELIKNIMEIDKNFKLDDYMNQHIYMFSGDSLEIDLRLVKKHIGDFIDWFGHNYRVVSSTNQYIDVHIYANENAVFYWALQYYEIVEVLKPESLRNRIKESLIMALNKYK